MAEPRAALRIVAIQSGSRPEDMEIHCPFGGQLRAGARPSSVPTTACLGPCHDNGTQT
jgi:hypothetical protein